MDEQVTQNQQNSQRQIQRQVAKIVTLHQIQTGTYEEKTGWEPNILKVTGGDEVSRVNVIGTVVELTENPNAGQIRGMVDDGSGQVEFRSFENVIINGELAVGAPVLLIARPKLYNNVIFLVPEIIRVLENKKWINYRKKQIDILFPDHEQLEQTSNSQEEPEAQEKQEEQDEQAPAQEETQGAENSILEFIDAQDKGEGIMIEEVVKEFGDAENTRQRITNLLLNGEIFEIRPGRVKILK